MDAHRRPRVGRVTSIGTENGIGVRGNSERVSCGRQRRTIPINFPRISQRKKRKRIYRESWPPTHWRDMTLKKMGTPLVPPLRYVFKYQSPLSCFRVEINVQYCSSPVGWADYGKTLREILSQGFQHRGSTSPIALKRKVAETGQLSLAHMYL